MAGPISVFHIGSNFEKDPHKIVFVGKNTWYSKWGFKRDRHKGDSFADATKTGKNSLKGKENEHSPYWRYIKYIIEKLYGDFNTGVENIAITNMIKCNSTGENGDYSDKTPKDIIQNCIESRIFEKEISALKPKHIVFLTGPVGIYDDAITNFKFGYQKVKKGRKTTRDNGKIIWWERELHTGRKKCFVLRTSHPQGKNKNFFVSAIVKWVKRTH